MTATTSPSPALRRRAVSVRWRIAAAGAAGVVAALAMGLLAWTGQVGATGRTADLQRLYDLRLQVADISRYNSDVSGWQTAYAWDASTLGPAEAVAPGAANRQGYLDSAAALKKLLGTVDVGAMTSAESTIYDGIVSNWDAFFAADDEVVALYASGTKEAKAQADAQIVGPVYGIYYDITEQTAELDAKLAAEAARAERILIGLPEKKGIARGQPLGVLALESATPGAFRSVDVRALESVAAGGRVRVEGNDAGRLGTPLEPAFQHGPSHLAGAQALFCGCLNKRPQVFGEYLPRGFGADVD